MLDLQSLLLIMLLVAGMGGLIIWAFSKQLKTLKSELKDEEEDNILMEWLKEMKGSVENNSVVLNKNLQEQKKSLEEQLGGQRKAMAEQTKLIWERLENSSKVIQQVHKELGGITEFGKDMKDLSNVLKSPKLRGGLGEQLLYEILSNSLPKELYKTQYKFTDGAVCDAVIKTEKGLIPIDSKFPMENFKAMATSDTPEERESLKKQFIRDVKKRVDEISSKYILPEEGTSDFAIMYVPSENVYYELAVNTPEIEDYSREKSVLLTSPNTLNYMVRTILVAYQQSELQKHAGEILKSLSGIKTEAVKFDEELGVLSGHIVRTYKAMDGVKIKFAKLFGKIERTQALGTAEETKKIS
ncbi:DNA recombination protein RmuC [Patescibacteria group bacterium]